jgi:hypothetical protein
MKKMKKILGVGLMLCLAFALAAPACAAESSTIAVVVPATGNIIINPYGLEVKLSNGGTSKAQLVHEPQAIVSKCDYPLTVNVSVTGKVANSSISLLEEAPAASVTDKQFQLYMEFLNTDTGWSEKYTGANNQLLVLTSQTAKSNVMRLDANGTGYVHFSGALASGAEYNEKTDTFEADVAFTFAAATTDSGTEETSNTVTETGTETVAS